MTIMITNDYDDYDYYHPNNFVNKLAKCRHTTLSGTPGGGKGKFLGGGLSRCDLLSNLHSPILPYVNSP